jgi:Phage integrase, N-terminal SAM-like domain
MTQKPLTEPAPAPARKPLTEPAPTPRGNPLTEPAPAQQPGKPLTEPAPTPLPESRSMGGKLVCSIQPTSLPTLIATAGERASLRFLEFFAANIRNPHTRRAYSHARDGRFMSWCADNRVRSITAVQPRHVAARIEAQTREHAAPTAKLRLAALRHMFDWLVTGQVMPTNPGRLGARAVAYGEEGRTAVPSPEEARTLTDAIEGGRRWAYHASTRTTQLYDRRRAEVILMRSRGIRV